IKTVEGPDDFASMEEVIFRRYQRVLNEGTELPQLILIDGGKGQLSSAINSLEKLNLRGSIPIVGIAKRLEELMYPDDPVPLYLDKNSETLRILQQLRNEAHRFGITFHRDKRSKAFISNELSNVVGIGEKTIELLLQKFKSVARLKVTPFEKIAEVVGNDKAGKILDYFKK
ncbi:MAG: excinuclease ABC subunit C, partial [Bacteroidia bacterium]|nr:excinuclease ABC subunit C [Bacteroidia bacterium]